MQVMVPYLAGGPITDSTSLKIPASIAIQDLHGMYS